MASAKRSFISVVSISRAGSTAAGSWMVSSRETWSPEESETVQSSSSATTDEFEIRTSDSWNSSTETSRADAISWSVGARWSWCSSLAFIRSISRAFVRTERGTQSSERSSSMMEPLMRVIAKVSNLISRQRSFSSMAFRFVSIGGSLSRPRVSAGVRHLEAARLYPSVGLGRADRGVSQQLLDRAQVGASFQQVGGERMAQRVGRDAGAARLELQPASHVRGGEAATALRQEQGVALARLQGRAPAREVAVDRAPGVLAGRDEPRAAPLPFHPNLLGVGIGARRVEVDELLGAQPGGVGQLEHRAIAQVERRGAGDRLQHLDHLGRLEHLRQIRVLLRARHEVRGVRVDLAPLDQMPVEGADRGQLARHRRLGRAALAEHGGEAAQVSVTELRGLEPAAGGPLGELAEIDSVGPPRLLPHPAGALPVVEAGKCGLPLRCHPGAHAPGPPLTVGRSSLLRMGVFFVNTEDGRVATRTQLDEAGLVEEGALPPPPWHQIQGPSDASTMWYAVLRKRERGVFIGTLCIRHTGRQTLLEERGWEEVPVSQIGP